mgnify:FL=1
MVLRPLLLSIFFLSACGRPTGILVGDVLLPGKELDEAVTELEEGFPSTGRETLRWQLLRFGMGSAALLHHRFHEKSLEQLKSAQACANRLKDGASFDTEEIRWRKEAHMTPPHQSPQPPSPFGLGARASAATATLDEGEWAGPLKTSRGWEIILLNKRFDSVKSRSHVILRRLIYPVGTKEDWSAVQDDWNRLPLAGDEEYLKAIPSEILRLRRPKSEE